ncbi:Laccase-7 [Acorus calamus]|uniref:Laccase n=1 Tax=Acorus calamus TaxID=4465 RepID=A0AAV9DF20_ACOCL|nr:Laccase-7 [Acorus calamus]
MTSYQNMLIALALCVLMSFGAQAAVVEHTFHVGNKIVNRLCEERTIVAVNNKFPGPFIKVHEGDTVIVHVVNSSPYNITIHWHGVFQLLTPWADGPSYITQCPISPGHSYTYKFKIVDQEGTLWWHAHVSWLRATVYGGLIIHPRLGRSYPFPKPHKEVPILLGEWWNANVVDVESVGLALGVPPNNSDAFTINARPGDLYPCSKKHTYKLKVVQGETYLLRIVNAALNNQLFFSVAGHSLTVVAADAGYTKPYKTDVLVLAPGHTTDVLLVADAPPARYYMAARAYISAVVPSFDNTITTGIIEYEGASSKSTPTLPPLPAFNDTPTAHKFYTSLKSLEPHKVPLTVDESMFVTVGLGFYDCLANGTCKIAASMNNASFEFPSKTSLLQAHFDGAAAGIYTADFPDTPPTVFDYTNQTRTLNPGPLIVTERVTKVKRVKFGATVEMVLQNTALVGIENHPIHLHGFNFYVLAQGFGNYNTKEGWRKFNLVDPQVRNTIAVPTGGWAVIRFVANNPGIWLMHCHLDVHLGWGLSMAFEVEDGPTIESKLPPPPVDLPRC